jgi:hypothetical protein
LPAVPLEHPDALAQRLAQSQETIFQYALPLRCYCLSPKQQSRRAMMRADPVAKPRSDRITPINIANETNYSSNDGNPTRQDEFAAALDFGDQFLRA